MSSPLATPVNGSFVKPKVVRIDIDRPIIEDPIVRSKKTYKKISDLAMAASVIKGIHKTRVNNE
jgi:hypothetical protein